MISHTFTGHHWPGLKAIIACTLKATDDISACAVAAGIADVALVSVCIEESYINPLNILVLESHIPAASLQKIT